MTGLAIPAPGGGGSLIQSSDHQVVLIQRKEEGITPLKIGESVQTLEAAADIVTIYRVNDAVAAAVSELNPEQIEDLRSKLKREDASRLEQFGPASPQYAAWVKERNQIYEILST